MGDSAGSLPGTSELTSAKHTWRCCSLCYFDELSCKSRLFLDLFQLLLLETNRILCRSDRGNDFVCWVKPCSDRTPPGQDAPLWLLRWNWVAIGSQMQRRRFSFSTRWIYLPKGNSNNFPVHKQSKQRASVEETSGNSYTEPWRLKSYSEDSSWPEESIIWQQKEVAGSFMSRLWMSCRGTRLLVNHPPQHSTARKKLRERQREEESLFNCFIKLRNSC